MIDRNQIIGRDAVFVSYSGQLGSKDVILLGQFQNALFQNHVVETALLPGTLGGFIVAPPAVPVAVVFLVVRNDQTYNSVVNLFA